MSRYTLASITPSLFPGIIIAIIQLHNILVPTLQLRAFLVTLVTTRLRMETVEGLQWQSKYQFFKAKEMNYNINQPDQGKKNTEKLLRKNSRNNVPNHSAPPTCR